MNARTGLPWLWLTGGSIVADQLSKLWILETFALYETRSVLPVLAITHVYNTGAAFSFLAGAGGWQRWVFVGLAVVVSVVIGVWLKRLDGRRQRMLSISLALIMGGALGNVIDRLRLGYVVDFVLAHWKGHYFPAFNVADACITVGAGLLLLDAFLDMRRSKTNE
ncbi:MAG: signal peptidase II [Steroidobacteraceae bacterium]